MPTLPLYPWQHSRHWRGNVLLPDIFSPIERDHPLLGHRVPSADGLWENVVRYQPDAVFERSRGAKFGFVSGGGLYRTRFRRGTSHA